MKYKELVASIILFLPSLVLGETFNKEYELFNKLLDCKAPYISEVRKGITYFIGRYYECHDGQSGDRDTVDFFLTENNTVPNKIEKATFRWRDHFQPLEIDGFRYTNHAHSGSEIAKKWLSIISKKYNPADPQQIEVIFFGSKSSDFQNKNYLFKF